MYKNSSARYYQKNKGSLKEEAREIYLDLSERKSDNTVANDIINSPKMKNKGCKKMLQTTEKWDFWTNKTLLMFFNTKSSRAAFKMHLKWNALTLLRKYKNLFKK